MVPNALMLLNGKGGVLKTSIAANLAGLAAASGWKVLAVDLDPQGSLARDLGCMEESDGGNSLLLAALADQPLQPTRGVRPGLDVVCGGPHTRTFIHHVTIEAFSRVGGESEALRRLYQVLAPVAGDYDMVVLDLPPGDTAIHTAAAVAAHYIVVPTAGDRSSNDGLGEVFGQLLRVREDLNSHLEILGVVLTLVPRGARAIERDVRGELTGLLRGQVRVFEATIRFAKQAALDYRRKGLLANEYELAAAQALPWYEAWREHRSQERFSVASSGLAEDYQSLVNELLAVFSERQAIYAHSLEPVSDRLAVD